MSKENGLAKSVKICERLPQAVLCQTGKQERPLTHFA